MSIPAGRGGAIQRRLAVTALLVVVAPVLALVGWAGWREVEAQRALLAARRLEAAEAGVRARLAALAEEVAARIDRRADAVLEEARGHPGGLEAAMRAGTVAAVLVDGAGQVVAPALPPATGAADIVPPDLRSAIDAGRDLEHRFRDRDSAIRHFARLLDAGPDAPAQARLLCELAATHAAADDWQAALAVAQRALDLDLEVGGLLGARDHVHLGLVRIEALVRLADADGARSAARRLARELGLAAAAGSFPGATFGLRRLVELLGSDVLPAPVARLDEALGAARRQGRLAPAIERARASPAGQAVLRGVARRGSRARGQLELLAVRGPVAEAGGYIIMDADLGAGLDAFAADIAPSGVRVWVRDPTGAPVLAPGDADGPRRGERVLALGGPLAGFTAEVTLGAAARGAAADEAGAERQTRLLLAILGAAGLAIAVAVFLLVRGAARSIELERTRTDFVAGVTHDLKTPLALVRMYAETLRLGRAEGVDERNRFLDVIIREADRLADLVQNVLAFQRRGTALRLAESDLAATLAEAVRGFAHARESEVEIDLVPPADLPPVPHDRDAVERIVRNLLSNATRFAPSGTTVRVRAIPDGAGVRIEVADLGPGIPEEWRLRAFDPFFTARPPGAPRGGTGLGLTVVRDLATAHGGSARLRENSPRGTIAEVWLRAAQE